MYFPGNQSNYIDDLLDKYNQATQDLHRYASFSGKLLNVLPHTDIRETLEPQQIALIEEGVIYATNNDQTAFVLQKGDFLFHCSQSLDQGIQLISEDCVALKLLNPTRLSEDFSSNAPLLQAWQTMLLLQTAMFANAYTDNLKVGVRPTAGFIHAKAGETIIHEGDSADEVFTLLKGKAKAISGETEVGQVLEGEIFGALAALTNSKRNASVVAETDCTVMSVPKEQFIDLVKARPETCLDMINSMARQISELNFKLQQQNDTFL